MSSLVKGLRRQTVRGLSSSPASDVNLRQHEINSVGSSIELEALPEAIEVEKKVEFSDAEAVRTFEAKIQAAGGSVVKNLSFVDCYYDTDQLILTRNDHFLRDRDGTWELKVPRKHSSAAGSVYAEVEGTSLITAYFEDVFPRNVDEKVLLPFQGDEEVRARGLTIEDDENDHDGGGDGGDRGGGGGNLDMATTDTSGEFESVVSTSDLKIGLDSTKSSSENQLKPFIEFATHRRRWNLEGMSIDVDEASFGTCLAEFELMVESEDQVPKALERIESAMMKLGVVGVKNQDSASKFVKFIRLDSELLQRTMKYAPAILV